MSYSFDTSTRVARRAREAYRAPGSPALSHKDQPQLSLVVPALVGVCTSIPTSPHRLPVSLMPPQDVET
ncbi:hypothetical protein E2C01_060851 [Portunus trituberculatus]|uniref:Uncharacterized protein n=1 Tax=Portunus trituberculatus TaxID=210409 RepID=A0A5B7HA62_PORTR|nr:hypothetical protein [Portunus trituberculatus]